jgi:hypothetical protein
MTDGAAGGKLATDVLGHYGGQQQEEAMPVSAWTSLRETSIRGCCRKKKKKKKKKTCEKLFRLNQLLARPVTLLKLSG